MKKIITALLLCCSVLALAAPLKNMVVFGDSLSDNGNLYEYLDHQLPQSPPYFEGRFTNGEVWVERLARVYFGDKAKSRLQDYAFGGAGVSEEPGDEALFTLRSEIQSYLLAHNDQVDADNLYIVWIGANNYLGVPSESDESVKEVITGIEHGLDQLVSAGARHILVANLPDLGRTPAGPLFDAVEELSYLSASHNRQLAESLVTFRQQHPDVQLLSVNVNGIFDDILNNPERFGFTNTNDTCFDALLNKSTEKSMMQIAAHLRKVKRIDVNACEGYLFFDPVHPTAKAHQLMSDTARQLLDESGVTFESED